jgi:rhodanese-related sulfurtransferase
MIRLRTILSAGLPAWLLAGCAEPMKPAAPTAKPAALEKPQATSPPRPAGKAEISSISLEEFFVLQQSGRAMIFDARPSFIYKLGHVPGAILLPKSHCDELLRSREAEIQRTLADGGALVVYCSGPNCPDARAVAERLSASGYPAKVFQGGWDAWKDAGLATE